MQLDVFMAVKIQSTKTSCRVCLPHIFERCKLSSEQTMFGLTKVIITVIQSIRQNYSASSNFTRLVYSLSEWVISLVNAKTAPLSKYLILTQTFFSVKWRKCAVVVKHTSYEYKDRLQYYRNYPSKMVVRLNDQRCPAKLVYFGHLVNKCTKHY